MNDNKNQAVKNREVSVYGTIKNIALEPNYVNIGVIKKVHSQDYVDVELYYQSNFGTENIIPDVRLLHIGTTKCKLNIQPSIGDNVLILTPKDFITVLEYNHKAAKQDGAYLPYSNNGSCGILIKDESDDNVLTSININEDGDVDFSTQGLISASQIDDQGEEKASVKVDADGNIAIKSEKNIHLNGGESESHLVRYEELQQGLNALWTAIKTHTHPVSTTGTATAQSGTAAASVDLSTQNLDISKAKIDTILTEKPSAT